MDEENSVVDLNEEKLKKEIEEISSQSDENICADSQEVSSRREENENSENKQNLSYFGKLKYKAKRFSDRCKSYWEKFLNLVKNKPEPLDKKQKIKVSLATIFGVGVGIMFMFLTDIVTIAGAIGLMSLAFLVTAVAIFSVLYKLDSPYKLSMTCIYIAVVIAAVMIGLEKSGFLAKFDTTEELIEFIGKNGGGVPEVIFVVIQFAQVTLVPIPSTVTTVCAALLFGTQPMTFMGWLKPTLLAVAGSTIGSMLAFWLGRVFGMKLVVWLIGKDAVNKYQHIVKGKDKLLLFFMFLFPFFPDDALCLLAGLTNMSYLGFFAMQLFCRFVGIGVTVATTQFGDGIMGIIPFSGWGIPVWIVAILLVLVLLFLTFKYSDKIEKFFTKIVYKMLPFLKRKKMEETEEIAVAEGEKNAVVEGLTADSVDDKIEDESPPDSGVE